MKKIKKILLVAFIMSILATFALNWIFDAIDKAIKVEQERAKLSKVIVFRNGERYELR